MKNVKKGNGGQVMLLTVMALSSGILAASVISGLVVMAQLRQSVAVAQSTRAIYAADAGLECGLYTQFKDPTFTCARNGTIIADPAHGGFWRLENGSRFTVISFPDPITGFDIIKSVGQMGEGSRGATRSFEVQFQEVTN